MAQQRSEAATLATAERLAAGDSRAEPTRSFHSKSTTSNTINHLLTPAAAKVIFEDELSRLAHNDESNLASVSQRVCNILAQAQLNKDLIRGFVSLLFHEAARRRDVVPELVHLCHSISKTLLRAPSTKKSMTRHFNIFLHMQIKDRLASMLSHIATLPSRERSKRSPSVHDIVGQLEFIVTLISAGIYIRFKPIVLYDGEKVSPGIPSRSAVHDCITLCLLSAEHEELVICGCRMLLTYASELTSWQPVCEQPPKPSFILCQHFARIKHLRETSGLSPDVIAMMDKAVAYGESNFRATECLEMYEKIRNRKEQRRKKKGTRNVATQVSPADLRTA